MYRKKKNKPEAHVNEKEKIYLKEKGIEEGEVWSLKDLPVRYLALIFEQTRDTKFVSFFKKRDFRDHYKIRVATENGVKEYEY